MRGSVLAAALATAAPGHVIVTSLGTAGRAWREHGGVNPTFYGSDPMGAAPGVALGAAVSSPQREFLLLEGDGDLCMNLGSVLAVADAAPANLHMVVFANARYETGGGQALAAAGRADIAGILAAAGWATVRRAGPESGAELSALLSEFLAARGPAALVVDVERQESPYGGPGELSGAEAAFVFKQQLKQWDDGRTEHS